MDAAMDADRRPVLFACYPESGLLNALMVLAGELARRGVDDLWFATDDPRREEIEALGGEGGRVGFVPLGEVVPRMSAVTWDDATYRAVTQRSRFKAHRAAIAYGMYPEARIEKYRRLADAVDRIRPAVMVVDSLCFYAIELAITRGIPFVLSVPYLPSNHVTAHIPFARSATPRGFPAPHTGLPYPMRPHQRVANQIFKLRTLAMFGTKEMRSVIGRDRRVRAELGVSPDAFGYMARVDRAAMVLCYSIPELDYPFSVPDTMRLVGPLVPPLPQAEADPDLTGWLDAHDSVVYAGFGTLTRLTRAQVEALVEVVRRLGDRHHVLWKLSAEQQKLLPPPEELPANLRVESWVPSQLDVLAHRNVKLFFTHAGGNGFHEGLYFGKPLVVRPLWVDNYDQAVRGRDAGVSLTLDHPETVEVDDVLDKLRRVLTEPSFRERAEHYGALLRRAGGVRAAADLLLDLPAITGR